MTIFQVIILCLVDGVFIALLAHLLRDWLDKHDYKIKTFWEGMLVGSAIGMLVGLFVMVFLLQIKFIQLVANM